MIEVHIAGIGLVSTGLESWEAAQPVLTGVKDFVPAPLRLPAITLLAANERRRAGNVVRLAITAAHAAAEMAALSMDKLRNVFASANGDGDIVHAILETLADASPQVSPTQFHNSVHNAPAGYWSIGTRSLQPADSLGCHDATVAASLLKAAAEARVEGQPVLLCVYDAPLPEPLAEARPTEGVFGAALVLTPDRQSSSLARLQIDWRPEPAPGGGSVPLGTNLLRLYAGNPAARLLPLLEMLARRQAAQLSLPLLDGHVALEVVPCSTDCVSSP